MSHNESQKVSRSDIKAKLNEIQGEATETVEGAKNQIIAVAAAAGLVLIVVIYTIGRRAGAKRSTIIELRRN